MAEALFHKAFKKWLKEDERGHYYEKKGTFGMSRGRVNFFKVYASATSSIFEPLEDQKV